MHISEENISRNPKFFWSFFNAVRSSSSGPSCMYYDNCALNDGLSIANSFAEFFKSAYDDGDGHPCEFQYENVTDISQIRLEISDVFKSIESLSVNGTPGVDGIPPIFIKSCFLHYVQNSMVTV